MSSLGQALPTANIKRMLPPMWAVAKRVFLFALLNVLVLSAIGVLLYVFGLNRYGQGYGSLLLYSAVVGFAGSFISLFLSKFMAKMSMGARVIKRPQNEAEAWLVNTVARQAQAAGIGMPEVAIYDSRDMNAFATGWSRNNALVAVSTGLLNSMRRDEVEAVLGHEVSHVANGDMVTMTLLQGVLNTFVIFASRVIAVMLSAAMRGERREGERSHGYDPASFMVEMVLRIVFGLLASVVLAWFSRQREFRADEGGARLEGKQSMIAALQRLGGMRDTPAALPKSLNGFGIRGGGLMKLFSTHPPLEERIAALSRLNG